MREVGDDEYPPSDPAFADPPAQDAPGAVGAACLTVMVPSAPPPVTPEVAAALLSIFRKRLAGPGEHVAVPSPGTGGSR